MLVLYAPRDRWLALVAQGWRLRLDSVHIGDVELRGVDAIVTQQLKQESAHGAPPADWCYVLDFADLLRRLRDALRDDARTRFTTAARAVDDDVDARLDELAAVGRDTRDALADDEVDRQAFVRAATDAMAGLPADVIASITYVVPVEGAAGLDALRDDSPNLDFFMPVGGATLNIKAKQDTFSDGERSGTFYKASNIDFDSRSEDYSDEDVEALPCLDDLLIQLSYKELEKKFHAQDAEDEDESDDEDEDTDDSDEEEEDDKPSKKKAKSKKQDEDDEEEDEDSEEESDDEEDEPAEFEVGDVVKTKSKYKGKVREGRLTKVDEKRDVYTFTDEDGKLRAFKAEELVVVSKAGEDDEDEPEDEEDETPPPKAKKGKKKPPVDDDDEDDDSEEDEDEEDDEPPAKKGKGGKSAKKSKKDEEEDESEDEDDDDDPIWNDDEDDESEEDDDEPPAKKKRKK